MNSQTIATIQDALYTERARLQEVVAWWGEDSSRQKRHQREIDEIDAALAELAALEQAGVWTPVEDGFIADAEVTNWWMHVTGCHITIGGFNGGHTYFLPDDLRLCRRTTAQEARDDGRLYLGNWRWTGKLVEIKDEQTGEYFFPDCGWRCAHCDQCIGCIRKMVFDWESNTLIEGSIKCAHSPTGWHVPTDDYDAETEDE